MYIPRNTDYVFLTPIHLQVSDPYNFERAEVEFGKIFKRRQREWPRRSYVVCTKVYWGK